MGIFGKRNIKKCREKLRSVTNYRAIQKQSIEICSQTSKNNIEKR